MNGYQYLRISRTIPFGYEVDAKDNGILNPIPDQLDKLRNSKTLFKTVFIQRSITMVNS